MVTIHSSYTVIPSESTPSSTLSLSNCDQIKLPNHGSQLYLYTATPTTTDDSSFNSLMLNFRNSLSKALTHYYPFAGRLCWIQGGRLVLLCNTKGAQLFEATSDFPLDDLGDFSATHFVEQLVPKIDYDVPIDEVPLLGVQLTRFPCGSLTLGATMCRSVVDGASVTNFMNSWAKLARGESLDWNLMPVLDRTVLDSRSLHMAPRFEHPEYSPSPLWEGSSKVMKLKPKLATVIFKLTKDQVEKLKKKANNNNNKNKVRGYTSFEVISGHLWRCVCKVRYSGNWDQPTRLTTLVNCRNRLNPPLPNAYFGNATFPIVTPTCSFDDVVNKPLSYAVGKIREAIERMSDEYVRSAIDYIANQKDMNLLRNAFYNSAGREGDPNLYVVGWANFAFYATDFGWGKPICLVPGSINSDGKAFLLNTGSGDGFIVAICLQPLHVDVLKKLFYEDMETTISKL